MKKVCNFCGAPIKDSEKECPQCGWDRSQDGPPSSNPADTKARIRVAGGLVVAYAVMGILIQGAPDAPRTAPAQTAAYAAPAVEYEAQVAEPAVAPIAIGDLPRTVAGAPVATAGSAKLLTIKIVDEKAVHIEARGALDYGFVVPETEEKCQVVGQMRGAGGFDRNLETFLLTDDEYFFWHANPAAIPHSSWDTIRGSETALAYDLPGAGTYHLIVSNAMSPTSETVQVKAQVKCTR